MKNFIVSNWGLIVTFAAVILTTGMMMQRLSFVEEAVRPISTMQVDIALIKQSLDLNQISKN